MRVDRVVQDLVARADRPVQPIGRDVRHRRRERHLEAVEHRIVVATGRVERIRIVAGHRRVVAAGDPSGVPVLFAGQRRGIDTSAEAAHEVFRRDR